MKAFTLLFLFDSCLSLRLQSQQLRENDAKYTVLQQVNQTEAVTLSKWLTDGDCFNIFFSPNYNSQHGIFGVMEYLSRNGLLAKMKGISSVSAGTLPAAFIAAGKGFEDFNKSWPEGGWMGFGTSEPEISENYHAFLEKTLPSSFKDLRHTLGIPLTHWPEISALRTFDVKRSKRIVASDGDLHTTLIAAVTLMNTANPGCPDKCLVGFNAQKIDGKYPVGDGGAWDAWGTGGLSALPTCPKLLQILPLDYEGQMEPPTLEKLNLSPQIKEMVTLTYVTPMVGAHSPPMEFAQKLLFKQVFTTKSAFWADLMYRRNYDGMTSIINQPLNFTQTPGSKMQSSLYMQNGLAALLSPAEQVVERQWNYGIDEIWISRKLPPGTVAPRDYPVEFAGYTVENIAKSMQRLGKDFSQGKTGKGHHA